MSLKPLTFTQLAGLAAAGSIVVLGGAFLFQALGFAPCKLCLWQRWPHAAAIALGGAAIATQKRIFAWLGALSAATTSAIGFYHSGVERKWWDGPQSCTGSGPSTELSAEELLGQIMDAPLVRCDEIPWEMLGLTMANLNALGSLALAVIWVMAARRKN